MTKVRSLSFDSRPHMVMVVNNSLHGDSRVQKSAVAAVEAGFHVTVLGLRVRTIESTGTVGGAQIFRAEFVPGHTISHNEEQGRVPLWEFVNPDETITSVGRDDIAPVFALDSNQPIEVDNVPSPNDRSFRSELGERAMRSLAARLGFWHKLWPMTLDYIDAFVPALIDLDPDIIHCHDYHPMPAVVSYVIYKARQGKKIPWVYDAHEWLPGQHLSGPTSHKAAWLAIEKKLIGTADEVISVYDAIASKMQRRHRLKQLPTVVTNAPSREIVPLRGARTDLRTDIGLSDEVPLLVYVGKLSELRGIYTAAEALQFLPQVHLAFVGSNSPREIARLNKIAANIGAQDRLHILNYVPAESVTAYVATADAGVSPLLSTGAHQSTLPTKMREYLHAGIPMIVSNMREQSRFIKETGVGEVHEAGDPRDFARATDLVLEDIESYRAKLTEDLLAEHSWEEQTTRLNEVWAKLLAKTEISERSTSSYVAVSSFHERTKNQRCQSALAYFVGDPQLDAIAEQWLDGYGDVLKLHQTPRRRIKAAVNQLEEIKARNIDLVLYSSAQSIFSGIHNKDFEKERRELDALGLDAAFYAGSTHIVPSRRIAKFDPAHPLATADTKTRGSIDRRVRLFTESFVDSPMQIFSHSLLAAALMPQVSWLPPLVESAEGAGAVSNRELKVAVLPITRSPEERALIARTIRELRERGIKVTKLRGRGFAASTTRRYDILIHSLHRIDMSEATAHHLASGGVLVGAKPYGHEGVPFWEVNSDNLVERLVMLVKDQDAWRHESLKSLEYSRHAFTPQNAVKRVLMATKPAL